MDRAYITIDDGNRDPSIAIWIQTESQYFDLRIPHDRPPLRHLGSLAKFDRNDLLQLARQSGDTGICTVENDVATWSSFGDRFGFYCDDVAIFPDDGRLAPRGKVLYEYDTPKSTVRYEEAWVQQPYDHGLVAHLTLREERDLDRVPAAGNTSTEVRGEADDAPRTVHGVLVVTGRYAGFVERATSGNASTLEAQLAATGGDLDRMRDILGCEASYAVRPHAGAPYVIRHSNHPFREGQELDVPVMDPRLLARHEILPARREGAVWCVESWFVK